MFRDALCILSAVVLPPLAVYLQAGPGGHFWLNVFLTLLGYAPGVIHAVWTVTR